MRLLSREGLLEPNRNRSHSEAQFAETIKSEIEDLCNTQEGSCPARRDLGLRSAVFSLGRHSKDQRSRLLDLMKRSIVSYDQRIQEVRATVVEESDNAAGHIRLIFSVLSRPLPTRFFVQLLLEVNTDVSLRIIKAGRLE